MPKVGRDGVGYGSLEIGPDELVRVELGGVAREAVKAQSRGRAQELAYKHAAVLVDVVPHNEHRSLQALEQQAQKPNHIGERTLRSRRNRAWRAMRSRLGETQTAEMAEILVQRPAQRSTGVFPRGAQVLATGGISRKPLSSMNTRWAPDFSAFFYMRPGPALPVLDGCLVTLGGPLDRLLAAPAETSEEAPHVIRVVLDAEAALGDLGDPAGGPHFARVTAFRRAGQQNPSQLLALLGGEAYWAARCRLGLQSDRPLLLEGLLPGIYRAAGAANLPRNPQRTVAGGQQIQGTNAALLQLRGTTHWSWHAASIPNALLLMRISVAAASLTESPFAFTGREWDSEVRLQGNRGAVPIVVEN